MILIRDRLRGVDPPPWMDGAADLQAVSSGEGILYGIGNPLLVGAGPARAWVAIDDQYAARIVPPLDPHDLCRHAKWLTCVGVRDLQGRTWMAPQVLGGVGDCLLVPTYDERWQPAWSPAQQRAIDIATTARQALSAAAAAVGDQGAATIQAAAACQWAAELLATANHITPQILGKLLLLDQHLVAQTLLAATGYGGGA